MSAKTIQQDERDLVEWNEPGTKISYQKSKGLKLWETLNTVARLDLNLTLALNILKTQDQIKLKNQLIQI